MATITINQTRADCIVRNTGRMRQIDTKAYLSDQSTLKMFAKTSTILASTGLCAGIGAGVGSMEGGIGALPGGLIGGGVGLCVGFAIVASWSSCEFKDWKKNQSKEVVATTLHELKGVIKDPELICAISHEPPTEPVVTKHSKQVYERENLEEWVSKHGTDPITKEKMTLDDIYHAPAAIGALHNICQNITRGDEGNFDAKQLEGVEILRKDLDKNRRTYLKAEEKNLMARIEDKKISIRDAGNLFKHLCDTIDPKDI
jgi:U-box domain